MNDQERIRAEMLESVYADLAEQRKLAHDVDYMVLDLDIPNEKRGEIMMMLSKIRMLGWSIDYEVRYGEEDKANA